jgi:putative phosphoesterase
MKIGIISDIHSNYHALKTVLNFLEDKIDVLICGGDFVGYGPQPQECIEAFADFPLPKYVCIGNHDLGVRYSYSSNRMLDPLKKDYNILKTFNFHESAIEMLDLNAQEIHQEHFLFLKNLPFKQTFQLGQKSFYLTHGTPSKRKKENVGRYLSPPPLQSVEKIENRLKKEKKADHSDIVIVGHTHQRFYVQRNRLHSWSLIGDILGKVPTTFPVSFPFKKNRIIFNPGSVGQTRDGTGNTSFVVLDFDLETIEFHDLKYPQDAFLKLVREKCVVDVNDEIFWANRFGNFSKRINYSNPQQIKKRHKNRILINTIFKKETLRGELYSE